MKIYNLYLDESTTFDKVIDKVIKKMKNCNSHFCIAGIIVEENYHNTILKNELTKLKERVWKGKFPNNYNEFILHEKD